MSPARKPNPAPPVGTSAEPGHQRLTEDPVERSLDEALQETFPASDAIAVSPEPEPADEVDEALKETFPASDPVAVGAGKPARPQDD